MSERDSGRSVVIAVLALMPLLAACEQEAEAPPLAARQVRTVVIEARDASTSVNLTGRIEAEDEVPLAFRISGRLLENNGKLGGPAAEPAISWRGWNRRTRKTQLRAAAAALSAAEAQYNQARGHYERQQTLFRQGWATRANYELAEKGVRTAASQVEAAAGADGCRGGSRRIYRTARGSGRRLHRSRPGSGRSGAGRPDDRQGRAPGRPRRRLRRPGPDHPVGIPRS